jgi:hypothetical protein
MSTINETTTLSHPAKTRKPGRLLAWLGGAIGLIVLLAAAAIGFMIYRMNYVPADLDLATTRLSAQGVYQATILPETQPIPVNQMHTWVLHVETAEGQPLTTAEITVDGDMPQHGHGMPTRPQVTQNLGGGDYRVEGMKFQMGGWWVIDFYTTANGVSDKVSFNLLLQE